MGCKCLKKLSIPLSTESDGERQGVNRFRQSISIDAVRRLGYYRLRYPSTGVSSVERTTGARIFVLLVPIWSALCQSNAAFQVPGAQMQVVGNESTGTRTRQIRSFRRIGATAGWLLLDHRLLWTTSGGEQWTDITPASPVESLLDGAFFLDTSTGWLMLRQAGGGPRLYLAQTNNTGKTWTVKPFPDLDSDDGRAYSGSVYVDFLDQFHGWAMLKLVSSSNFSFGVLYSTHDGGETWTRLPNPPIGDPVRFLSPLDGWLAGGPRGDQIFITRDGGFSWQLTRVSESDNVSTARTCSIDLPVFTDNYTGMLAMNCETVDGPSVTVYRTNDGGETWVPPLP